MTWILFDESLPAHSAEEAAGPLLPVRPLIAAGVARREPADTGACQPPGKDRTARPGPALTAITLNFRISLKCLQGVDLQEFLLFATLRNAEVAFECCLERIAMAYVICAIMLTLVAYMLHEDWRDAARSRYRQRRKN
jgi:hypothetical protein